MKRKWKGVAIVTSGVAIVVAAFIAGRSLAGGIPATNALSYAGTLADATGTPLTGDHNVEVKLWNVATGGTTALCATNSQLVTLKSGRFSLSLPDTCTAVVAANPDIWVEVLDNGMSLGRTKAGAVPYAVEANHAINADTATNAANATGALATTISAIQGQVHSASGFHAWLTAATNVPSGTAAYTKVLFDHVEFDSGSEYTPTTGIFTAKAAGVYLIVCAVDYNNTVAGSVYQTAVFLNGVRAGLSDISASVTAGGTTAEQTTITRLAANDTVWCSTTQTSGAPASLYLAPATTQFAVTRLY